jgi:hypothetical protein
LTLRKSNRQFTQLTNAFSKKLDSHKNAAIHFMHYNFCQIHQTLRVTPGMQTGNFRPYLELERNFATNYLANR